MGHRSKVYLLDVVTDLRLTNAVVMDRLKKVDLSVQDLNDMEGLHDQDFEVSLVMDHKFEEGCLYYLMLFDGYPDPEWVKAERADGCQQLLDEYWQSFQKS
eukprot:Nk52_evm1s421 gene=Nk52_evmTU1s421